MLRADSACGRNALMFPDCKFQSRFLLLATHSVLMKKRELELLRLGHLLFISLEHISSFAFLCCFLFDQSMMPVLLSIIL